METSLDELLQSVVYWVEHSDSAVTWPFVKRGLNSVIEDLRKTLKSRPDRRAIEEDIAKIEEFITRRDVQ